MAASRSPRYFFHGEDGIRYADWSSDVCSSDLVRAHRLGLGLAVQRSADEPAGVDAVLDLADGAQRAGEIGRASCRERVWISGVAECLKNIFLKYMPAEFHASV